MRKYVIFSNTSIEGKPWRELSQRYKTIFCAGPSLHHDFLQPMLETAAPKLFGVQNLVDFEFKGDALSLLASLLRKALEDFVDSREILPLDDPSPFRILGKPLELHLRTHEDSMMYWMHQLFVIMDDVVAQEGSLYFSIANKLPFN